MYEALASGVPVTVALEGVVADVLKQSSAGFSVPFEDSAALGEAIRLLLDDPILYQRCSQNARKYAEENFDAEKAVDAYEAALKKAVAVD